MVVAGIVGQLPAAPAVEVPRDRQGQITPVVVAVVFSEAVALGVATVAQGLLCLGFRKQFPYLGVSDSLPRPALWELTAFTLLLQEPERFRWLANGALRIY